MEIEIEIENKSAERDSWEGTVKGGRFPSFRFWEGSFVGRISSTYSTIEFMYCRSLGRDTIFFNIGLCTVLCGIMGFLNRGARDREWRRIEDSGMGNGETGKWELGIWRNGEPGKWRNGEIAADSVGSKGRGAGILCMRRIGSPTRSRRQSLVFGDDGDDGDDNGGGGGDGIES